MEFLLPVSDRRYRRSWRGTGQQQAVDPGEALWTIANADGDGLDAPDYGRSDVGTAGHGSTS